MANNYRFVEQHIELDTPPKRPKKLTATRFATVMGLNAWSTPFEAWCAITRTYEEPFEDTVYTIAGKVIEPKVIEYLSKTYFLDLKSPADVYGKDYFKKTFGNFFADKHDILGGMWDAIGDELVVEIKTTKRAEDWEVDAPIYYKLQAALYAYLLGFDQIILTASFLEDKDYEHPEKFKPSVKNTVTFEYSLAEDFPTFEESYVEPALAWWERHVVTGISPDFDEKKDADILKELRKTAVSDDDGLDDLLEEAEVLMDAIAEIEAAGKLEEKRARLKAIEDEVKKRLTDAMPADGKTAEVTHGRHVWTVTKRKGSESFDKAGLKKAEPELYNQFVKQGKETFALTKKEVADE